MLELNKDTLKDAINRLSPYSPRENLWDRLELEMDKSIEQNKLQETIHDLPTYTPPDLVWDNIDAALEQEIKQPAKVVGLARFRKIAAAAAMIGVMFALLFTLQKTNQEVQIAYTTETVEGHTLAQDWNEDEDAFTYIKELCANKAPVCTVPGFMDLNDELEGLNSAKESLQNVIGEYETDADLIMQLAKIERERSDLLKQMLTMI